MTDSIEAVARALSLLPRQPKDSEQEYYWRKTVARAAILETLHQIREPGEAVAIEVAYAASAVLGQPVTEAQAQEIGRDIFQAGIDSLIAKIGHD